MASGAPPDPCPDVDSPCLSTPPRSVSTEVEVVDPFESMESAEPVVPGDVHDVHDVHGRGVLALHAACAICATYATYAACPACPACPARSACAEEACRAALLRLGGGERAVVRSPDLRYELLGCQLSLLPELLVTCFFQTVQPLKELLIQSYTDL